VVEFAHKPSAIGGPLAQTPIQTSRKVVPKADEVEGLATSGTALLAQFGCKVAEPDKARLLLLDHQLELR